MSEFERGMVAGAFLVLAFEAIGHWLFGFWGLGPYAKTPAALREERLRALGYEDLGPCLVCSGTGLYPGPYSCSECTGTGRRQSWPKV